MKRKINECHEIIFKNPWCPLFGEIPWEENRPDSAITQCCFIIHNARGLLSDDGYFLPDWSPPSAQPSCLDNFKSPCDVCEKSKVLGMHHLPCNDLNCNKHVESTTASEKAYKMLQYPPVEYVSGMRPDCIVQFPCDRCDGSIGEHHMSCNRIDECREITEYEHALSEWRESIPGRLETNVLIARAIFNNFWAIKDHTLGWQKGSLFASRYGNPDMHTLASVWERAIEQARDLARYHDGRQLRLFDERDISDHTILSILAISVAWYTLADMLHNGASKNDPYVLKDTSIAKELLAKANEVLMKPDYELGRRRRTQVKRWGEKGIRSRIERMESEKIDWWLQEAESIRKKNPSKKPFAIAERVVEKLKLSISSRTVYRFLKKNNF